MMAKMRERADQTTEKMSRACRSSNPSSSRPRPRPPRQSSSSSSCFERKYAVRPSTMAAKTNCESRRMTEKRREKIMARVGCVSQRVRPDALVVLVWYYSVG